MCVPAQPINKINLVWYSVKLFVGYIGSVCDQLYNVFERVETKKRAVEAIVPFVQISGQICWTDAMECAVQPRLEVVELQVDQGREIASVLRVAQEYRFMLEALSGFTVASPAIDASSHPCETLSPRRIARWLSVNKAPYEMAETIQLEDFVDPDLFNYSTSS